MIQMKGKSSFTLEDIERRLRELHTRMEFGRQLTADEEAECVREIKFLENLRRRRFPEAEQHGR